jgi:hypothetical protein
MFLVCGLTKIIPPDFCCPCSLETVLKYGNLSLSLFQAFIKLAHFNPVEYGGKANELILGF